MPQPLPEETQLARQMQQAWGNFLRTGDPNPLAGDLHLPRFTSPPNPNVNYSIPVSIIQGYRQSACDFWDKFGYTRQ